MNHEHNNKTPPVLFFVVKMLKKHGFVSIIKVHREQVAIKNYAYSRTFNKPGSKT